MENIDVSQKALKAIHSLIIETRIMVGNKEGYDQIFNLLDDLEYLPALLLEKKDNKEMFNSYLKEMCESYKLNHIYNRYIE